MASLERPFRKRTFSLRLLLESAGAAALSSPVLLAALVRPATSAALREKVMLAVTSVNDCRYCSWVHTGLALESGVDLEALGELLDRDTFGAVEEREAVAILYAKHFADTLRAPCEEAETALAEAWGSRERAEIMAYVHAIYFANLSGNSADAWLARLEGRAVEDGHALAEAIAACLAAPFLVAVRVASLRSRRGRLSALWSTTIQAPRRSPRPAGAARSRGARSPFRGWASNPFRLERLGRYRERA